MNSFLFFIFPSLGRMYVLVLKSIWIKTYWNVAVNCYILSHCCVVTTKSQRLRVTRSIYFTQELMSPQGQLWSTCLTSSWGQAGMCSSWGNDNVQERQPYYASTSQASVWLVLSLLTTHDQNKACGQVWNQSRSWGIISTFRGRNCKTIDKRDARRKGWRIELNNSIYHTF